MALTGPTAVSVAAGVAAEAAAVVPAAVAVAAEAAAVVPAAVAVVAGAAAVVASPEASVAVVVIVVCQPGAPWAWPFQPSCHYPPLVCGSYHVRRASDLARSPVS